MSATARNALADAVSAAADAAREPEPEQLAFLPPSRFESGEPRHARLVAAVKRDQAGRPPGARNKTTRETLDFVRKVLGDPVLERARMASHTPESLAAELGCTKLQAAQFIDNIRADLARLYYAPLAPVDGQGNAVPVYFGLTIGGQAQGADGRPPWTYLDVSPNPQAIGNKPQSAMPETASHSAASHEEDKPS